MIRVTGGRLRTRRLKTLGGTRSRPTLSKVREAVFNILGEGTRAAVFVDLFAGVGTMGIEALSRGAESAIFVERDARCASILEENLNTLGLASVAEVVVMDAVRWMERESWSGDIVFVDPPYESGLAETSLGILGERTGPEPGWIVVQHGPGLTLPEEAGTLGLVRHKEYGDTVVDFYQAMRTGAE
jgi:16S rRNA (guanine966-N2)-methyltransferase